MLLSISSVTAHAAGYMKYEGIDGITVGNDLIPNPADVYEQECSPQRCFVKSWTTSGDADDRPTEEVAFGITFLNGQSPTLTAGGWTIDAVLPFDYSVDLRRGNDPFVTHMGSGTAHVVGSAPVGPEPRIFDMEVLSFDISGVYNGVSPFLIRESPTVASTGQTTMESLPGGQYRIDSFFDVFTEMSVDGGSTWFEMVPEPSTILLSLLATLGLGTYRRRC
jgi:hypothetical protein